MSVFARAWAGACAPVKECDAALRAALASADPIVLTAAPGSGKTTLVPFLVRQVLDELSGAFIGEDGAEVAAAPVAGRASGGCEVGGAQAAPQSGTPPAAGSHPLEAQSPHISTPADSHPLEAQPPHVSAPAGPRLLVAQPRRVAVTAAARYVAHLCGEDVGGLIGMSMRGVRQTSPRTRIEFTTTGSLLRRLIADPDLTGVDAVIVDEVHERHLDADLVLAFLHDLRFLREDLTVLAMSATADTAALGAVFSDAHLVEVNTPTFPLTEYWEPFAGPAVERHHLSDGLASHLLQVAARAYRDHGPTLVFAPAIADVDRLVEGLKQRGLPALPLHSAVSSGVQRRALAGGDQIVVATDIAQTSLTIDGVRCVVDSGLSRQPRFDPARDTPMLVTVGASRAAMVQRAGRAHRQGPGVVYRCLHPTEWARARQFDPPQCENADLTAAVLAAYAWSSVGELALPSAFPAGALARAEQVGSELGALAPVGAALDVPVPASTPSNTMAPPPAALTTSAPTPPSTSAPGLAITDSGRLLAHIPADPRLAHALLAATYLLPARFHPRVADTVALLSTDPRLPDPDLTRAGSRAPRAERERFAAYARRWASDYGACLPTQLSDLAVDDMSHEDVAGLVVALAFPRWVARRSCDGGYLSVGAGALTVPDQSTLAGDEWIAAASIQRVGARTWVRAGAPLRAQWVPTLCWAHRQVERQVRVDKGMLVASQRSQLGDIEGPSVPLAPPFDAQLSAAAWSALERLARADGVEMFRPRGAVRTLVERLQYVSSLAAGELRPQLEAAGVSAKTLELAALTPEVVAENLHTLLGDSLPTLLEGAPLSSVDLRAGLYALVGWELPGWLDANWVSEVVLPSGRRAPVVVDAQRGPTVRAKLQECFGWREVPTVLGQTLTVELLSPAGRPLAITADLQSFFNDVYPQVRADMRGRYPKHPWPEDPWQADATALTKAALARRRG